MRIAGSNVAMASQHGVIKAYGKQEKLEAWVGERPGQRAGQVAGDRVEISDEARRLWSLAHGRSVEGVEGAADPDEERLKNLAPEDRVRVLILERLFKIKIKVLTPEEMRTEAPGVNPQPDWGLHYEAHEFVYERESLAFAAEGIIRTADGQEISFSVELSMTREFYQESHFELRAGNARKIDPLVINYGGTAAELTETRFAFDLDVDGTPDQMPTLQAGSGFLALDQNGDGLINDGSELFGPQSGDGFADLAQHDEDGNNWIDESDPIYERLRIWTRDAAGKSQLFGLGQKGIGAIFLGNILAPFSQAGGEARTAGVFVREEGGAGTVQHLDINV